MTLALYSRTTLKLVRVISFASLAVFSAGVSAVDALAWNNLGHKVVAEIAWQQLEPEQRKSIVETLRRHPKFDRDFVSKMDDNSLTGDKAIEDHWIFLHAATWPDIIRDDKEYDRPDWHYIDLPTFLDLSDKSAFAGKLPVNISTEFPSAIPQKEFNAVQAIQLCKAMLASKAGPDVKAMAYCWLMHLVGDIHQPLHCTALFSVEHFPKGDKGGNYIKVQRGKNLHSLWDGLLGRQYYLRDVVKVAAELSDKPKNANIWESAGKETDARSGQRKVMPFVVRMSTRLTYLTRLAAIRRTITCSRLT